MDRKSSAFQIPVGLEEVTGYLINQCAKIIQDQTALELLPSKLNPRLYRVIYILNGYGPLSQQSICEKMDVDKNSMVQMINQLEDLGFVKRKASPSDQRSYIISNTSKASAILDQAQRAVQKAQDHFLAELSEAEKKLFNSFLRKILIAHKTQASEGSLNKP